MAYSLDLRKRVVDYVENRKTAIRLLVEEAGHQILFLPKYSPDLNDIEHDFSALKRAIMYSHSATSLDEIIRAYCAT